MGGNLSYNVPTETVTAIYGSLDDAIKKIIRQDSIILDSSFNEKLKAMAIYSIDPIGMSTDFYIRYGLIKNFDLGYAWASGVHAFDFRYQFLDAINNFDGSVGVKYSSQSYELPSMLGKLQSLLKYKLERKDLLIPLAISNSLGKNELYGAIGYGAVYGRTWINYDYESNKIYEMVSGKIEVVNDVPQGENSFNSYGLFLNLKLGYKHVYGILGLSGFYQDYGRYNLFQDQYVNFSGFTFVPNFGLQLTF